MGVYGYTVVLSMSSYCQFKFNFNSTDRCYGVSYHMYTLLSRYRPVVSYHFICICI